jgi:glycosyltransferase involved in cell wall biosynthesis
MNTRFYKYIYFAPANSLHSFRWIEHLRTNYNIEILWISFHNIENQFMVEYPNYDIKVLDKEHILINSRNPLLALFGIIKSVRYLNKLYKDNNFDFLHVHSYGKYGIVSSFLKKSIPIIGTAWGSDIIFSGNSFRYFLLRKALLRSKVVTCDAIHMVERIKKISKKINVHLILFGSNQKFTILSLRNHFPVYDIETLLSAFFKFAKGKSNVFLNIAGYGELTGKYRELVANANMVDRVFFLGKYNRKSLLQYFSQSNLYVSTSKSDAGLASSTAEAMACRLPVLISDSGENSLWIENNINGFLFKTSNEIDLLDKLNLIYGLSHAELSAVSENGYLTILRKNNLNIEMKKFVNLYEELY